MLYPPHPCTEGVLRKSAQKRYRRRVGYVFLNYTLHECFLEAIWALLSETLSALQSLFLKNAE
jgi:hypothetical protein